MKSETITVTPEAAKWMLSTSVGNRAINKKQVSRYAKDMASGSWILSGEPIIFGGTHEDPHLIEGHHRCHACIMSNTPFVTDVRYGISMDAFRVIDTGRARSGGDVLSLAGYSNGTMMAATVRWIWVMSDFSGNTSVTGLRQKYGSASINTVLSWIEKNDRLMESAKKAQAAMNANPKTIATVLAALHFIASRGDGSAIADAFVDGIGSGAGLNNGDPRLTLRNRLIARASNSKAETINHMAVLHVYAWNAFAEGRTLNKMLWREGDRLPSIKTASSQKELV